MLKNNIEKDIKGILIEKKRTQEDVGKSVGTSGAYISRLLKKDTLLNPTFLKVCEELGYDVEISYVER